MRPLQILKNKYFLATVIFAVWVLFFAQYDLITQRRQQAELREMKDKIRYLEVEVDRLHHEKTALKTDTAVMERYSREKYFMSTPQEEVFVFDTLYDAPASKPQR